MSNNHNNNYNNKFIFIELSPTTRAMDSGLSINTELSSTSPVSALLNLRRLLRKAFSVDAI